MASHTGEYYVLFQDVIGRIEVPFGCLFAAPESPQTITLSVTHMPLEFLISALVTLLVVVGPIGLVPSYLAITHGLPQRARRSVALHATLVAGAILVGSALVGD